MLTFYEEEHIYKDANDRKYQSVSNIISSLHKPFDADRIATDYALKHGKEKDEVLAGWAKKNLLAVTKGKLIHSMYENQLMTDTINTFISYSPSAANKSSYTVEQLQNLKPGKYPELILYLPRYGICGTADLVTIYPDRTFDILDYKGLALDTYIPTPKGFKKIGDIVKGDIIYDGNGLPTPVVNVSEIHHNPCFRITFDTNDTIVCDHEHKWEVAKRKYKGNYVEFEKTTKELFKDYNEGALLKVKCTKLQNGVAISLPVDPYVFGVWLGDGSSCSGTITNTNPNTWSEIKNRGYAISTNHSRNNNKAETHTVYTIVTGLNALGCIKNKHLPDVYLQGSEAQRLDLLRGFMDADGYFNKKRKRFVMVTTKEWQADALMSIVASLGEKPTKIKAKASGFGKTNIAAFHVCFSTKSFNPFLTRNMDCLDEVSNKGLGNICRIIKKIERIDMVPTVCLAVESPAHTYLVTKNFIKTHNTNEKIEQKGFFRFNPHSKTRSEDKLYAPFNKLGDCNYNKYSIQMSFYAYMLETFGYTCNDLILQHVISDVADGDSFLNEPTLDKVVIKEVVDYKINYHKKEVETWLKKKK